MPESEPKVSEYEAHLDVLQQLIQAECQLSVRTPALEASADALAFVQTLWEAMGEDPTETPDLSRMENLWDAYMGELSAAALFLSQAANVDKNILAKVPSMLREQADRLEKMDTEGVVPLSILKGYRRFARRIELADKMAKLSSKYSEAAKAEKRA